MWVEKVEQTLFVILTDLSDIREDMRLQVLIQIMKFKIYQQQLA